MSDQKVSAINPFSPSNKALDKAFKSRPWLSEVLVVGLGGSVFTVAGLYLLHWLLEFYEGSGLIDPQARTSGTLALFLLSCLVLTYHLVKAATKATPTNNLDLKVLGIVLVIGLCVSITTPVSSNALALTVTFFIISILSYLALIPFSSSRTVRTSAICIWSFCYMALWMIGASTTITLLIFVIFWIVVGLTGGLLLHSINKSASAKELQQADWLRRRGNDQKAQAQDLAKTRRRAGRTSGARSRFGRIPQDTVDLFGNHVRRVTGPIVAALPIGASIAWRNATVSIILSVLIRDWRENDNFDALTPQDIDDLQSFVEMAASLASTDGGAINLAIFKACLNALAQDWLANWNATNTSGPPERIY